MQKIKKKTQKQINLMFFVLHMKIKNLKNYIKNIKTERQNKTLKHIVGLNSINIQFMYNI